MGPVLTGARMSAVADAPGWAAPGVTVLAALVMLGCAAVFIWARRAGRRVDRSKERDNSTGWATAADIPELVIATPARRKPATRATTKEPR